MHELSLCNAIADTATHHAGGRRVTRVRLQVGHFRQVVPDTLHFCWRARTDGSILEGCDLDIVAVPAVIRCHECGGSTALDEPILRCGGCGSRSVELLSGEEFLIESIDVAEELATSTTSDDR